jgi:hypothetical protein
VIPVGIFKNTNAYGSMSAQLWGKDALGGLDAAQASNKLLGAGGLVGVVILGPDSKVLWKGSSPFNGSTFYTVAGNPPVPFHDLREAITPLLDQGLFGGLTVPAAAQPIAKLLRVGNLPTAQAMLGALKGDASVTAFKTEMTARLEKLRQDKRALFDDCVKAEKTWDAFKIGMSYVKSFPKAADLADVKAALKIVQASPAVKSNLASKSMYAQLAASGFGTRSKPALAAPTSAAMGQIAQKYGETEFGKYASSIAK